MGESKILTSWKIAQQVLNRYSFENLIPRSYILQGSIRNEIPSGDDPQSCEFRSAQTFIKQGKGASYTPEIWIGGLGLPQAVQDRSR